MVDRVASRCRHGRRRCSIVVVVLLFACFSLLDLQHKKLFTIILLLDLEHKKLFTMVSLLDLKHKKLSTIAQIDTTSQINGTTCFQELTTFNLSKLVNCIALHMLGQ